MKVVNEFYFVVSFVFMIVLLAGVSSAATPISECTVIDQPGEYYLTTDILLSDADTCINIITNNVVFDGQDNRIDGSRSSGIKANGTDLIPIKDVTIKNVWMTNWGSGINFVYVEGGEISNNKLNFNSAGIKLFLSEDILISNNDIVQNRQGINLNAGEGTANIDIEIRSNNIEENTGSGIYIRGGKNIKIVSNKIIKSGGYGIEPYLWRSRGLLESNIENNEIRLNERGGILHGRGFNMFINNIIDSNGGTGLDIAGNNIVSHNTITNNVNTGLSFSSGKNTITNNNIGFNHERGMYIGSAQNAIYENYLNNKLNIEASNNLNILEMNERGNYYEKPDGTGYSQTCNDADGNRICDESITFSEGTVDNYPLKTIPDTQTVGLTSPVGKQTGSSTPAPTAPPETTQAPATTAPTAPPATTSAPPEATQAPATTAPTSTPETTQAPATTAPTSTPASTGSQSACKECPSSTINIIIGAIIGILIGAVGMYFYTKTKKE
jgi:parallel beta-helix repeat protein